jgi:hypothetical protein
MNSASAAARPRAVRAVAGTLAAGLVLALGGLAPGAAAVTVTPSAVTPPAAPTFTSAIDTYADYQEQSTCSPVAKPGAAKLARLLVATYGAYTVGIPRACGQGGISEHKEGRALDWMVSARNPVQKAKASAFLKWLLATDKYGNEAAMARRLGVMYIGWDDQMWRGYDVARGWDELRGCYAATKAGPAYDNECHRSHVHISLTWEGAMALTSFWSGSPVNATCRSGWGAEPSAPVAGGDLVPVTPVRVLDTRTGTGLEQPCRVGAPRWSNDTSSLVLDVTGKGEVPDTGVATVALRVTSWSSSAPRPTLRVRSTSAAPPVPAVTSLSTGSYSSTVVVPVAGDGTVRLSLDRGTAEARVDVVGWAPPLVAPAGAAAAAISVSGPTRLIAPTTVVDGTQAPLEPGETRTVDLSGSAGLPGTDLRGVAVTLVTGKSAKAGTLYAYTPGSTLAVGQVRVSTSLQRSAPLIVPTPDGRIVLKNAGASPVAVSVRLQGWFTTSSTTGGARTRMLSAPVTVVDSSQDLGITGALPKGAKRYVALVGKAGIPAGVRAVLLSVTATGGTAAGTLTITGSGALPAVAYSAGTASHELVLVPLGPGGSVAFSTYSSGTHVRAAVVGWAA